MRAALWLIGLFGAAVAVALFAGGNQGTVTVFWPPDRVDLSVNFAVLLLVALFVLVHLALRAFSALLELPRQARRWRAQQRERTVHTMLLDASMQYMAGRFLRARKAADGALERTQGLGESGVTAAHLAALRTQAHLNAGQSAHALQDEATRERHLQAALEAATTPGAAAELREGVLLRAATWALNTGESAQALSWLDELPTGAKRRTAALRIKLKAARQSGHIADAMETARLLAKHRAFSPQATASLMRALGIEQIARAWDAPQLQQILAGFDAHQRATPELALRAAQRLLELGGDAALARQWLVPAWDAWLQQPDALPDLHRTHLVQVLEEAMAAAGEAGDPAWLARIESAQRAQPRDVTFQYLAGMVCLQRGLWGKAQSLLTQATRGLDDVNLRRSAWRALAALAEQRGDQAGAAAAWREAAQTGAA